MPLLEGWLGLLSLSLSLLLTLLTLLSPILSLLLTLLLCSRGEVVFNRGRHALITLLLWLLVFKVINLNKLPFSSWHCLTSFTVVLFHSQSYFDNLRQTLARLKLYLCQQAACQSDTASYQCRRCFGAVCTGVWWRKICRKCLQSVSISVCQLVLPLNVFVKEHILPSQEELAEMYFDSLN